MQTPAHVIFGAAAFGKPGRPAVAWAAVIGGFLPDLPLMVMVGWSLWVQQVPGQVVFDLYYFSDSWQSVFAIDHGIFIWGTALALGIWAGWQVLVAFAGSGLLHAAIDFFLHHGDARSQLWPLTNWKFLSPVSYYERAHYGQIFGPVEIAVSLVLCAVLWRRFDGWAAKTLILLIGVTEAAPGLMFALMPHVAPI